jgi:hypothetical protein
MKKQKFIDNMRFKSLIWGNMLSPLTPCLTPFFPLLI